MYGVLILKWRERRINFEISGNKLMIFTELSFLYDLQVGSYPIVTIKLWEVAPLTWVSEVQMQIKCLIPPWSWKRKGVYILFVPYLYIVAVYQSGMFITQLGYTPTIPTRCGFFQIVTSLLRNWKVVAKLQYLCAWTAPTQPHYAHWKPSIPHNNQS